MSPIPSSNKSKSPSDVVIDIPDSSTKPKVLDTENPITIMKWKQLIALEKTYAIIGLILSICVGACEMIHPYLIAKLYQTILSAVYTTSSSTTTFPTSKTTTSSTMSMSTIMVNMIPLIVVYAAETVFRKYRNFTLHHAKVRFAMRTRDQYFCNMQKQDLTFMHSRSTQELTSILMTDASQIFDPLLQTPIKLIVYIFQFIAAIVISAVISWEIMLIIIACGPIFFALHYVFNPKFSLAQATEEKYKEVVVTKAAEIFEKIRIYFMYTRDVDAIADYRNASRDEKLAKYKSSDLLNAWLTTEDAVSKIIQIALLIFGMNLVVQGSVSAAYFIIIQMYGKAAICAVQGAVRSMTTIGPSAVPPSGRRLVKMTERVAAGPSLNFDTFSSSTSPVKSIYRNKLISSKAAENPDRDYIITLNNVSFRYASMKLPLLNNLNVGIDKNTWTAIVGRSGSGKSTLLQLFIRMYDPEQGSVLLKHNNNQVSYTDDVDLRWLRNDVALVEQEAPLLDGTVRENIIFGCKTIGEEVPTQEDLDWAADMACCKEFIESLPDGWNTNIGRGCKKSDSKCTNENDNNSSGSVFLSAGMKQRIAIARAFARRPSILLLDEASSCLDVLTERNLYSNISKLRSIKKNNVVSDKWYKYRNIASTIVSVEHRLGNCANADLVVVMSNGQLIEEGPPAPLARAGGMFSSMLRASGINVGQGNQGSVPAVSRPVVNNNNSNNSNNSNNDKNNNNNVNNDNNDAPIVAAVAAEVLSTIPVMSPMNIVVEAPIVASVAYNKEKIVSVVAPSNKTDRKSERIRTLFALQNKRVSKQVGSASNDKGKMVEVQQLIKHAQELDRLGDLSNAINAYAKAIDTSLKLMDSSKSKDVNSDFSLMHDIDRMIQRMESIKQ